MVSNKMWNVELWFPRNPECPTCRNVLELWAPCGTAETNLPSKNNKTKDNRRRSNQGLSNIWKFNKLNKDTLAL